jgi:hypothetical protein
MSASRSQPWSRRLLCKLRPGATSLPVSVGGFGVSTALNPLSVPRVTGLQALFPKYGHRLHSALARGLRVRLKTLLRIAKFSQHEADGRKF